MSTYVFDLDGTIREETAVFDKPFAKPYSKMIEVINKLYDEGHTIIIYTACSWAEYKVTEMWLQSHLVNYHVLLFGKPIYDYWIDDRAINSYSFMEGYDRET